MNIQIWGQTGWLPSRPSMLCARETFFSLRFVHSPKSMAGRVGVADGRRRGDDGRGRDGRARGIRTWKYARCSPSLSSVAIDEEIGNAELQPQCQSACRAVYNMMAGLFWRPASLPWSHVGLPSAAAAVFFFALSSVISSRGNLCIEGPRAVLLLWCVHHSFLGWSQRQGDVRDGDADRRLSSPSRMHRRCRN